jgi:hypothetical protein
MNGMPKKKTFKECDAATRFRWAMQYLVCVLVVVFLAAVFFWFAYATMPLEVVFFLNLYLVAGVYVCDKEGRQSVRMDGTWNWRGWCRQIYWWMWWPYFVWLRLSSKK